jgi:hypothetical protein
VFSEDEESALGFRTLIEQKKESLKKLQENKTSNTVVIANAKADINRLQKDLKLDLNVRNIILTRN